MMIAPGRVFLIGSEGVGTRDDFLTESVVSRFLRPRKKFT